MDFCTLLLLDGTGRSGGCGNHRLCVATPQEFKHEARSGKLEFAQLGCFCLMGIATSSRVRASGADLEKYLQLAPKTFERDRAQADAWLRELKGQ